MGKKIDDKTIREIERSFGNKGMKVGVDPEGLKVYRTGSLALDVMTGIGGYPCGKVTNISGQPSVGKSTMIMKAAALAQQAGKKVVYIDTESTFSEARAEQLGIDLENLLVVRVKTLEVAGEILVKLVSSGEADFCVFDSLGGASIQQLEDGEIGDSNVGTKAKRIGNMMMKLTGPLGFYNKTVCIFVNQWRDSFDPYKVVIPGGWAYNHAMQLSLILTAKKIKELTDGSITVTARANKNKVGGVQWKTCSWNLSPDGSLDRPAELISVLTSEEYMDTFGITRAGAWYYLPESMLGEEMKFQGSDRLLEKLRTEPEVLEQLENVAYSVLTSGKSQN